MLTFSMERRGRKALPKLPVLRRQWYSQHTRRCVVDELRHANNARNFFATSTEAFTTRGKANALHGMKIVGPHSPGAPLITRVCSGTQALFWHFCAGELSHFVTPNAKARNQTRRSGSHNTMLHPLARLGTMEAREKAGWMNGGAPNKSHGAGVVASVIPIILTTHSRFVPCFARLGVAVARRKEPSTCLYCSYILP